MINAEGGGGAVAGAVWRVLAPRLALQCAELRQVLPACFTGAAQRRLPSDMQSAPHACLGMHTRWTSLLPATGAAVSCAGQFQVPGCWDRQCATGSGAQYVSSHVQAVIALGGPAEAGAELALLVAGVPRQQAGDAAGFSVQPGLAAAFSEAELRQLLDWERAAALLAMHRTEAAARAAAVGAN